MTTITVRLYGLWQSCLGISSLNIEAEDVDEALVKLDNMFDSQLQSKLKKEGLKKAGKLKDNSVVLLNGISLRNLKEMRLKKGDILYVFPPIGGG